MSGSTLNDIAGVDLNEGKGMDSDSYISDHTSDLDHGNRFGIGSFDFLKAETGEGEVEDYLTHPLNFNSSKGMARILRGMTGMFGSMRYAVIDIMVGTLDLMKTNKIGADHHDRMGSRSENNIESYASR